jgi:hypothetical protein
MADKFDLFLQAAAVVRTEDRELERRRRQAAERRRRELEARRLAEEKCAQAAAAARRVQEAAEHERAAEIARRYAEANGWGFGGLDRPAAPPAARANFDGAAQPARRGFGGFAA